MTTMTTTIRTKVFCTHLTLFLFVCLQMIPFIARARPQQLWHTLRQYSGAVLPDTAVSTNWVAFTSTVGLYQTAQGKKLSNSHIPVQDHATYREYYKYPMDAYRKYWGGNTGNRFLAKWKSLRTRNNFLNFFKFII